MRKIVSIIFILFYNNILLADFVSHVSSNTSHLAASPIVIQSIQFGQSNNTTEYTTQILRLHYSKSMMSPVLATGWQKNLTAPVSEPVYVGVPDFPFPDRWPWTHDVSSPPENNISAQKYSDFQNANIQRTPIVYQIDGQYVLHGLDLKTGQSLVTLNLNELLAVDLFSNLTDVSSAEPQITISDVFVNNRWHTLLIAAVGDKRQTIFCLDITHPFLLTAQAAKNQLWWQKTDSRGYFSRPTVIRTIDGDWNILFAQTGCLDDVFVAGIIKIYSLQSGWGKAEIILPAFAPNLSQNISFKQSSAATKGKKTDMAQCQNRIQFTHMSPIDSKSRGYVDYLYVGDNFGTLWKFDMTAKTPKQWGLVKQTKDNIKNRMGVFSMIENNQYGQILSQPKIISHPNGQGVLISFLAQSQKSKDNYMISIFENGQHAYLFSEIHDVAMAQSENWYINNQNMQSTPVVRNGRVLTVSGSNAAVLNMKDGKVYAKSPYKLIENNSNTGNTNHALEFVGYPLIFQRGASEPNVVLHALANGDFAWTEIEIESDRMGRRVWRELNE